jgi:hypothetical protein
MTAVIPLLRGPGRGRRAITASPVAEALNGAGVESPHAEHPVGCRNIRTCRDLDAGLSTDGFSARHVITSDRKLRGRTRSGVR